MKESPKEPEPSALYANATQTALAVLAKCLMKNGALKPGQFLNALKDTFNETDADWERLDYQYLRDLVKMLEDAEH